jgi:glycolate oxidase iron-sulfur subunit
LRSIVSGRLFERRRLFRALVRCYAWFGALGPRELRRYVGRLSARFFRPRGQRLRSATLERRATLFYHAGCVEQVAFSETCQASLRVLQHCGCEVVVPGDQVCCGAWAIAAGQPERARALARRNVAAFERADADILVADSAGCSAAMKDYRTLLAADPAWNNRAARFSSRVRDATEWLDEIGIAPELGALALRVAYVDPCRLVHRQRVAGSALRLLRRIPGLAVRVGEEATICCGGPGAYALRQPEMSRRLAARKLDCALACEPDAIVTADPECALQLRAELRARGNTLPVRHVVELLDDAYAAYKPTSGASAASASSTVW